MKIRFLGAAREVTGSCYHLTLNGTQFLVDCGMHQGKHAGGELEIFQFDPAAIECVFLTHAHIDHSGLLPRLVKQGFQGRIITTTATADLVEIMLLDSAHIQESDAEWLTKKAFRSGRNQVIEPLYTSKDVLDMIPLIDRQHYGSIENAMGRLRYRLTDAGHILGSASLELWYPSGPAEKKIVFSGDIGKKDNPIINDPQHAPTADTVVIESTYGNRNHRNMEESIDELVAVIESTFQRGGNVLIPSFAVGRTQDLLYILNKLVREKRLGRLDVYVDSPLAKEATQIYLSHPEYFDQEALKLFKLKKMNGLKLHFSASIEDSQKINRIRSGAVIMAGGGMCEGGRIRHHLKHNLWRPECSIVFVGFQAAGTLGRKLVDGAKSVQILGEEIAVLAQVHTIGGFSAHGDQTGLLEWLGGFTNQPEVFIVHGEETAALDFEKAVQEKFGFKTHVPHRGDEFEI
jgi:metallo-beta-lactamase family protein